TKTSVIKLSSDPELPVVIGLVNQCWPREHALKSKLVVENPDNASTWRHHWVLINAATQTDNSKNFVLLDRESRINFPRDVESVARNVILKVHARINLRTYAGKILHNILHSQVAVCCLQMVRQTIVGAAEIVAFVFDAGAQVPFASD